MKAKVTAAVILLAAALSIGWLLISLPPDDYPPFVLASTALALLVGSVVVFRSPRFSYWLGLVSGLVALYWFSRIEFAQFPALNSWIALNFPDGYPHSYPDVFLAKLKILFAATVVVSTACCATRLLPPGWLLRGLPIRERTWPAFAVCFLSIATWYAASASPYRVPLIVDGVWPELTVLHVEKRGIQFHETAISVYQDGKLYVQRNDRKLFRYQFAIRGGWEVLPEGITAQVRMLAQSDRLRSLHTLPAVSLRNTNAEGWYVHTGRGVLAFTTEYRTEPPKEVVDLFRRLESVGPAERELGTLNDICMGFCYDPLAGLGLVNFNDRCFGQNGNHCK